MRVGVVRIEFHVNEAQSLESKRQVLRSIKDRLVSRFDCAASEVGSQDLWQKCELGIAIVSLDAKGADQKLRKVEEFVQQNPSVSVISVDREIFQF